MTHHRDPVVARALADLPVPEHAPDFWARLDERLAAEDAATRPAAGPIRADTGELPTVTALHPHPEPPRRQRLAFLAAAAAVAVLALVGGALLVTDDGDGDGADLAATTTAAQTDTTPESAPGTPTSTDSTPTTATTTAPAPAGWEPQDAVRRWIDALGAGDTRQAVALVGPGSEAYLRSTGQTVEEFVTVASEGYGAWSASPDAEVVLVDIPGSGVVVVLQGTVTREGTTEQAVQALPVVPGPDGTWFVEPIAANPRTGGRVEMVTPLPQPGYWEGQPPDVVLEAASEHPDATFWFALDGEPAVEDADGVWDPPGELASGTHLLVVAVVGDDLFTAVAGTFAVEG